MAEESAGLFWLPDRRGSGAGSTGGCVLAKEVIARCRIAAREPGPGGQAPGAHDNSVAQGARSGGCAVRVPGQSSGIQCQHAAIGGGFDRQVESAVNSVSGSGCEIGVAGYRLGVSSVRKTGALIEESKASDVERSGVRDGK